VDYKRISNVWKFRGNWTYKAGRMPAVRIAGILPASSFFQGVPPRSSKSEGGRLSNENNGVDHKTFGL